MYQLGHAGFTLGRAEFAVEVFAGDDIGGGLRPVRRNLDVALLEYDGPFIIADRSGTGLPGDLIVRRLSGLETRRKMARQLNARAYIFRTLCLHSYVHSPTSDTQVANGVSSLR